jgi:hypothetical protein
MTDVATRPAKVATVPKGVPALMEHREPTVMDLMAMALEKGGDAVAQIERLVSMKMTLDDRAAAQEFAKAMAEFQRRLPPLDKGKLVDYVTKSGAHIHYRHATLAGIAAVINPILAEVGLSYTWDSKNDGKFTTVTCTVWHVGGHSRSASHTCPNENPNPGMTDAQKGAGATTFGERYSLIQVLGLTTADPDLDGMHEESAKVVSDDQALAIADAVTESGIDKGRFLAWLGVSAVAEIPADRFTTVMQAIEQKRREKEKAGR